MGGRAEGQACPDPGARTPIGASGNFGPSVLRATSGLDEQLRETIILGIGPSVLRATSGLAEQLR